jgi:hypothetical protein
VNRPELHLPPQNISLEETVLATILIYETDDFYDLEPSD